MNEGNRDERRSTNKHNGRQQTMHVAKLEPFRHCEVRSTDYGGRGTQKERLTNTNWMRKKETWYSLWFVLINSKGPG